MAERALGSLPPLGGPHWTVTGGWAGSLLLTCSHAHPQDSELLTFSLSRHRSWWHEHGPGCLREEPEAGLGPPDGPALGPGVGCVLERGYAEALHSALQILLAVSGGGRGRGSPRSWARPPTLPPLGPPPCQ